MKAYIGSFCLFILSLSVSCAAQSIDTTILGTINSFPFTQRETELCARNYKQLTLEDSNSPIINELTEFKIQQQLALKLGFLKDISYKSFYLGYLNENKRRDEAKSQKKVFYGPVQFTEDTYFSYYVSNLVLALKKDFFKSEYVIDEKRLFNLYEEKKESLYKIPEIILSLRVRIKSNPEDSVFCSQIVKSFEKKLRKSNRISIDNPYSQKVKVTVDYLNVNPESFAELEKENYYEFLQLTQKTGKGELITRQTAPGIYEIYKILNRVNNGFRSFETVKKSLISMEADTQYAEYIRTLKKNSIIVQF
jgi:hypothetical protein